MAKLSEIFDLQMGKTPARANSGYWEAGTNRWVSIADLSGYEKYVGETKEQITDTAVRESGIKAVPPGTVIMSFKLSLGKTAITKGAVYTNEAIMAFIPKGSYDVSPDYFFYMLSSRDWAKGTNRAVMGATLNKGGLGAVEVAVPPLDEQRRAAAVLDKVSGLISLRKQQLAKLDELAKAQFAKRFGGSPGMAPLNQVCTFIDYRGRTPEKSKAGIPLITAKNVRENAFSIEPQEFIPAENYERVMTRGIPKENDVLFTTEAPLGNVCRIPGIYRLFCVGQRMITMQPKAGVVTSEYLEYALRDREFQDKLWEKASGSTVKGIRSKLLEWLPIPVPPYTAQCDFSEFVCRIDRQRLTIQQGLDKLEVLKKALIQGYFGPLPQAN